MLKYILIGQHYYRVHEFEDGLGRRAWNIEKKLAYGEKARDGTLPFYTLTSTGECDCADYIYRHSKDGTPCKHQQALAKALNAEKKGELS